MTQPTYGLGDRVIFTRSLHRHTTDRKVVSSSELAEHRYRTYKVWTVERWIGDDNTQSPIPERSGIVIGKRTLANGHLHYGWDEGDTFRPDEHFTAYLIAYDLHRKPVYVLPEHIQPATQETP